MAVGLHGPGKGGAGSTVISTVGAAAAELVRAQTVAAHASDRMRIEVSDFIVCPSRKLAPRRREWPPRQFVTQP
jgi:hypothetical protein